MIVGSGCKFDIFTHNLFACLNLMIRVIFAIVNVKTYIYGKDNINNVL